MARPTHRLGLLTVLVGASAVAQVVDFRVGRWSDAPGLAETTFTVVRWATPWHRDEAAAFASALGARLASLNTSESVARACTLAVESEFWQCAGPWIGPVREASQSWRWEDGQPIAPASWAPGFPAQASGLPACLLLAGDGEPAGGIADALDAGFAQPVTSSAILRWIEPADCDQDGVPDSLAIAVDMTLDADGDGLPDRCVPPSPDLDGSGQIDFGDVAIAMLEFGPCAGCASDLDRTGTVDFGDVAIIMLCFGTAGLQP